MNSISSHIFIKDGVPMEFVMRTCHARNKIQLLVEKNGGVFRWKGGVNVFRIADPGGQFCYDEKDRVISSQFVYDCIEQSRLLDVKLYIIEPKAQVVLRNSEECPMEINLPIKLCHDIDTKIIQYILGNQQNFVNLSRPDFLRKLEFDEGVTFPNSKEFTCQIRRICKLIGTYGLSSNHISTFINLCTFKNVLPFYKTDDMKILNYIVNNDSYEHVKGSDLWEDMEIDKVTEHSANSMCIRFHHTILSNLNKYHLSPGKLRRLEINANLMSSKPGSENEKSLNISATKIKQQLKVKLSVACKNATNTCKIQDNSQRNVKLGITPSINAKTNYLNRVSKNKRTFSDFEKFRNPKVSKNNKIIFVPRKLHRGVMAFKLYRIPEATVDKPETESIASDTSLEPSSEHNIQDLSIDSLRKVLDFKLSPEAKSRMKQKSKSYIFGNSTNNLNSMCDSNYSDIGCISNDMLENEASDKENPEKDKDQQTVKSNIPETYPDNLQHELKASPHAKDFCMEGQHKTLECNFTLGPNISDPLNSLISKLRPEVNNNKPKLNNLHSIRCLNEMEVDSSLMEFNPKSYNTVHCNMVPHKDKLDTSRSFQPFTLNRKCKTAQHSRKDQSMTAQHVSIDGLRKSLGFKLSPKLSNINIKSITNSGLEKTIDSNILDSRNDVQLGYNAMSQDRSIFIDSVHKTLDTHRTELIVKQNVKSNFKSLQDFSVDKQHQILKSNDEFEQSTSKQFSANNLHEILGLKHSPKISNLKSKKKLKPSISSDDFDSFTNLREVFEAKNQTETNDKLKPDATRQDKNISCDYILDSDSTKKESCSISRNIKTIIQPVQEIASAKNVQEDKQCQRLKHDNAQEQNAQKPFTINDLRKTLEFRLNTDTNGMKNHMKTTSHNSLGLTEENAKGTCKLNFVENNIDEINCELECKMPSQKKYHPTQSSSETSDSHLQSHIMNNLEPQSAQDFARNSECQKLDFNNKYGLSSKKFSIHDLRKTLESKLCSKASEGKRKDECDNAVCDARNSSFDSKEMSIECDQVVDDEDTMDYLDPGLDTTNISNQSKLYIGITNDHSKIETLEIPNTTESKSQERPEANQYIQTVSRPSFTDGLNKISFDFQQKSDITRSHITPVIHSPKTESFTSDNSEKVVDSVNLAYNCTNTNVGLRCNTTLEQKNTSTKYVFESYYTNNPLEIHDFEVRTPKGILNRVTIEDKMLKYNSTSHSSDSEDIRSFSIGGLRKSLESKLFKFDNIRKTLGQKLALEDFPSQSPPVFYRSKLETAIRPQNNSVSDICNIAMLNKLKTVNTIQ